VLRANPESVDEQAAHEELTDALVYRSIEGVLVGFMAWFPHLQEQGKQRQQRLTQCSFVRKAPVERSRTNLGNLGNLIHTGRIHSLSGKTERALL
jgi:hypothetical protein